MINSVRGGNPFISRNLNPTSTLRGDSVVHSPTVIHSSQPVDVSILLEKKLQNPSISLTPEESIALLFECIRQGDLEAQKAVKKELTIFIGNTGAGKSTIVNSVYGCELEAKSPKELGIKGLGGKVLVVKANSPIKEITPIGHNTKKSMTFMPKIATDQKGITYCDCPGFLDNRGWEINSANAVNIKKAFTMASSVKVVMLINFHSLKADKARGLRDMISIACNLFGSKENLVKYIDSILLGITQIPLKTEDDDEADIEDLKAWIKEDTDEISDQFEKTTLQYLSECLFIYDPLNRKNLKYQGAWSRETLLRTLDNLTPIEEPLSIFKTVLTAEDEKGLTTICGEIKEKIQKILKQKTVTEDDFKTIARYQENLKKLEIIENHFILNLTKDTRNVILTHFRQMVHRFDICCADTSMQLINESQTILDNLKNGISYFDENIQADVNVEELDAQFNLLMKKKNAKEEVLLLDDLEEDFRTSCAKDDFIQANKSLKELKKAVLLFEKEYKETGIKSKIDLKNLESLYNRTKKKYDEGEKLQKEHQKVVAKLQAENLKQQRMIEAQKKEELIRKREVEAERRAAEEAAQKRKISEQKRKEEADALQKLKAETAALKLKQEEEDKKKIIKKPTNESILPKPGSSGSFAPVSLNSNRINNNPTLNSMNMYGNYMPGNLVPTPYGYLPAVWGQNMFGMPVLGVMTPMGFMPL